ncbi:uncharacterized protein LOC116614892 [Nematostella vectensis]|uniref:uncharacterized protein LOC116614892 n=1 Tax=Nematostella vectensis TaxID=45351 RepID=UPI00207764B5|nr:uncharacterized protein LOC116614892 [Nematostella vectensis]
MKITSSWPKSIRNYLLIYCLITFILLWTLIEIITDAPKGAVVKQLAMEGIQERIFARVNDLEPEACVNSTFCAAEPWLATRDTGLAAFLLETLDHFSVCYILGGIPTVSWRACKTICSPNASVDSWSWYFEPVNPGIELKVERGVCIGAALPAAFYGANFWREFEKRKYIIPKLLDLSFQKRNLPQYMRSSVITERDKHWAHFLISKHVKVRKSTKDTVDAFYNKNLKSYRVLAVHIRRTDHYFETDNGKLPALQTWITNAKEIWTSLASPKRIFVASDNSEAVNIFVNHFGSKNVRFTSAIRARRYYDNAVHTGGLDPYTVGSQVLIDILLMSKCDLFLRGVQRGGSGYVFQP